MKQWNNYSIFFLFFYKEYLCTLLYMSFRRTQYSRNRNIRLKCFSLKWFRQIVSVQFNLTIFIKLRNRIRINLPMFVLDWKVHWPWFFLFFCIVWKPVPNGDHVFIATKRESYNYISFGRASTTAYSGCVHLFKLWRASIALCSPSV